MFANSVLGLTVLGLKVMLGSATVVGRGAGAEVVRRVRAAATSVARSMNDWR